MARPALPVGLSRAEPLIGLHSEPTSGILGLGPSGSHPSRKK